jgi:hypothetical protein
MVSATDIFVLIASGAVIILLVMTLVITGFVIRVIRELQYVIKLLKHETLFFVTQKREGATQNFLPKKVGKTVL